MNKICCFIGHRKVELGEAETLKLKMIIENLIVKENVCVFLFGSRSEFDYLCHEIVTELKNKYPNIKRKRYTCISESCVLEHEREHYEKIFSSVQKKEVRLLGFEEEVEFKNKWKAGKASYVERNQAMINDSDLCVFYYLRLNNNIFLQIKKLYYLILYQTPALFPIYLVKVLLHFFAMFLLYFLVLLLKFKDNYRQNVPRNTRYNLI